MTQHIFNRASLTDLFKQRCGYDPDFDNPQTFNEKVFFRKFHDRRNILVDMTGKITARSIALATCSQVGIIPFITPRLMKWGNFSLPLVMKPTNKSGQTRIIKTKQEYEDTYARLMQIKDSHYGIEKGEWAYSQVPFQILLEPVIQGFIECHFYCFSGQCAMFICVEPYQSLPGRPTSRGPGSFTLFDSQGLQIPASIEGRPTKPLPAIPVPELVAMAERLSCGLDFVRVDLLYTPEKTWFSEYTFYPSSGCYNWRPHSFDRWLGDRWVDQLDQIFRNTHSPDPTNDPDFDRKLGGLW